SGARVVERSGHGLGLTFCKLAIEAHGGRIWIEDAAPGAVFCLRLPHGT
ncbi:MAG TPA: ATP-binding protein, partial [Thermoanaerobaculia bacterium]